jgi:type II secretory pathway pseudopilin PulG
MKILRKYRAKAVKQKPRSNDGFTLIETAAALTTLGICVAYAMPLFLYAKLNNAKTESRTGALMVAQRVFDKIRSQKKITDIPILTNTTADKNGCILDAADPNPTDLALDSGLTGNIKLSDPTKGFVGSSADNATPTCLAPTLNYLKATSGSNNDISYKALGKKYATRVIFCQESDSCDANSRKFKVEVFGTDGGLIYELSGTYANFE